MKSTWWKVLIAYVIGAVVIGLIVEGIESGDQQRYGALVSHGIRTTGQVTLYEPSNHDNLKFTFTVGGESYEGGGSFHYQGNFRVGQPVTVVYEAGNPYNNCACDPPGELANAQQTPIVGGLWLAIVIPFAYLVTRHTLLRPPPGPVAPLPGPLLQQTEPLAPGQRTWRRPGLPRWLWSGGYVAFDLGVTAQDAAERLARGTRPEGLFDSLVAPGQLRGWVRDSRFSLTLHLPLLSNSFNSIFDGQIVEAPGGCRVVGTLRLRALVVIFLVVWMVFACIGGLVIVVSTLVNPGAGSGGPPLAFGFLFPLGGVGVMVLGRLLAGVQERALVARLEGVLTGARP